MRRVARLFTPQVCRDAGTEWAERWGGRAPNSPPALPPQRVFPYISAMVNNGSLTYDHDRDGRPTELGGCTAMVRNLNHDTFLVIRYVKRRLTVGEDGRGRAGSPQPPPGATAGSSPSGDD